MALGVVTQRQTPFVTISRTTAIETTILQHLITNQKNSEHTHLWRILRYKQNTDKVSLKLHKALSKTFCLHTVNFFYSPSVKMVILLADSHSSFILVTWFLACQTNTLNCYFLIITTLPASNLLVVTQKWSHSSSRQKLVPTPLAI